MKKSIELNSSYIIYAVLFAFLSTLQVQNVETPVFSSIIIIYLAVFITGFIWFYIYLFSLSLLFFFPRHFFPKTIDFFIFIIVSFSFIWLCFDVVSLTVSGSHLDIFKIKVISQKGFKEISGISDKTYYTALAISFFIPIVAILSTYLIKKTNRKIRVNIILFFSLLSIVLIPERLFFAYGKFYNRTSINAINESINWRPKSSLSSLFKNFDINIPPQSLSTDHAKDTYVQSKNPNIIIIMAESLRTDMLSKDIMPNLNKFSGTQFRNNFSTSNGTHFGLISLLYGIFPTYYESIIENEIPSPLFQLVNQNNYETHTVSSYHFNWFGMQKVINKDHFDYFKIYDNSEEPWEQRDLKVKDYFKSHFKGGKERPQFFYITLNSTHHNYFYPENSMFSKFKPVVSRDQNLFTISKDDAGKILNRHKNAALYIDSLVGEMIEHIKKQGEWENTLLVFFGDHGEEFFEDGHTTHANKMNIYQNSAALFIHKPDDKGNKINYHYTSHIDVLPTLWEQLGAIPKPPWFRGENLYNKQNNVVFTTQIHLTHPSIYGVISDGVLCRLVEPNDLFSLRGELCSQMSEQHLKYFYKIAKE